MYIMLYYLIYRYIQPFNFDKYTYSMKIKFLNQKNLDYLRKNKKKIVLCHGVFDLVHIGHVEHFHEAKQKGDVLVVSVTSDSYVNKGPGRPFFSTDKRLKYLSSFKDIDYVIESKSKTAMTIIDFIKPDVYFKGPDYKIFKDDITGNIVKEMNLVKKNNGKIFFSNSNTYSSSKILNKIDNTHQFQFLKNIKKNFNKSKLEKIFTKLSNLKIMIIGETILDEYIYCDALGKSGKEPILTYNKNITETYLGGSLAIAQNISEFVKKVYLISALGEKKENEKFILKKLKSNIASNFIYKKDSPTIIKTKIFEQFNNNKVLGFYEFNDETLDINQEKQLFRKIKSISNKVDMIIISDYGHGLISKSLVSKIKKLKITCIVNTQINSANLGYHTISKFKGYHYAIINEVELRHELRDRSSDIKRLMKLLSKKLDISNLVVTAGKQGSYLYNRQSGSFIFCPALAVNIVDKVGAGDAMLSFFSLATALGKKNPEFALFFGSIAAAKNIESQANKFPIKKEDLLKSCYYFLK